MRLSGFRVGLSFRFYLILVLGLITFGTGAATGFELFYRLLYVILLTVVASYVWTWLMLRRLDVTADERSRQVRVGDDIEETLTARNQGVIPKHALEIQDQTDVPGGISGAGVNLSSGSSLTWDRKAIARARGMFSLGPIRVTGTDPFGLFRRHKRFGPPVSLMVYPRVYPLPGFEVPAADLFGESATRKRTHNVTPHASTVRDYAFGDSLSRVHWNSTARLGKLMSKEFDLGRASEIWIVVDLFRDVQAGELEESTDEYAVTIAASLAKRYLDAELPVGLVAYGDLRYFLPAETGTGQEERIMQYLALGKPVGTVPLEIVLPNEEMLWGHNSSLVVVTSSHNTEWPVALRELTKRGVRIVAVHVDAQSFGGFFDSSEIPSLLYSSGIQSYTVKKGDDIPAAMGRPSITVGASALQGVREVAAV